MSGVNWGRVFAFAVAVLQACAGVGYGFRGNFRMAAAWTLWAVVSAILAY